MPFLEVSVKTITKRLSRYVSNNPKSLRKILSFDHTFKLYISQKGEQRSANINKGTIYSKKKEHKHVLEQPKSLFKSGYKILKELQVSLGESK